MTPREIIRTGTRKCGHPACWCAWCKICGERLTNCDFTEQDALEVAMVGEHDCKKAR